MFFADYCISFLFVTSNHQTTDLDFPNFFLWFFQLLKLRKIREKIGENKIGCLVVWCHEQDKSGVDNTKFNTNLTVQDACTYENSKFVIIFWKREEQISNRSMFNLKNTKPSLLLNKRSYPMLETGVFMPPQKNCTFSSIMSCSWDPPTNSEFPNFELCFHHESLIWMEKMILY